MKGQEILFLGWQDLLTLKTGKENLMNRHSGNIASDSSTLLIYQEVHRKVRRVELIQLLHKHSSTKRLIECATKTIS